MQSFNALVSATGNIIAALIRRKEKRKQLEISIWARGIVAEMPYDFPCRLIDSEGAELRHGVYVICLMIQNKGSDAIESSDTPSTEPIQIHISEDNRILDFYILTPEDHASWNARKIDDQTAQIDHQGINAGEYAFVGIYITGSAPLAQVKIRGRIIGQTLPIDRTDKERKATWGERLSWLFIITGLLTCLPMLAITSFIISHHYGISALWDSSIASTLPLYLIFCHLFSLSFTMLIIFDRISNWLARRSQPEGFPLLSDIEPLFTERAKAIFRLIFTGRKYRISTSLFSYGEPYIPSGKMSSRRSIDDWIHRP